MSLVIYWQVTRSPHSACWYWYCTMHDFTAFACMVMHLYMIVVYQCAKNCLLTRILE